MPLNYVRAREQKVKEKYARNYSADEVRTQMNATNILTAQMKNEKYARNELTKTNKHGKKNFRKETE